MGYFDSHGIFWLNDRKFWICEWIRLGDGIFWIGCGKFWKNGGKFWNITGNFELDGISWIKRDILIKNGIQYAHSENRFRSIFFFGNTFRLGWEVLIFLVWKYCDNGICSFEWVLPTLKIWWCDKMSQKFEGKGLTPIPPAGFNQIFFTTEGIPWIWVGASFWYYENLSRPTILNQIWRKYMFFISSKHSNIVSQSLRDLWS